MADKIKLGLICVGLEGERNDLGQQFHETAKRMLACRGFDIVNGESSFTLTGEEVREQTRICTERGADSVVYMTGTWILAQHVTDAVRDLKIPFGIWGIPEAASFSSVGANVLHGTFDEMGQKHQLFYGMPDDDAVLDEVSDFARAAFIKSRLAKTRLGILGGRAISAYPTTADPIQIKKIFGVEVEHIDQMILLQKAEKMSSEECGRILKNIREKYGSVEVPENTLEKCVRVYLALKEIIMQYDLDMISVKCIGEFMDSYTSCCLALSMLNDEGCVCGCQCNINAIISGYILTKLSGSPHFFGDVNMVDVKESTARMINCGSVPGRLAENRKDIHIVEQYAYMGAGRGACTYFCCKEGSVTFGTLGRKEGQYVMHIAEGTAFKKPLAELESVRTWAQAFIKLHCDPVKFYKNLRCNHSVFVYGNYGNVLRKLCELLDIKAAED